LFNLGSLKIDQQKEKKKNPFELNYNPAKPMAAAQPQPPAAQPQPVPQAQPEPTVSVVQQQPASQEQPLSLFDDAPKEGEKDIFGVLQN
jgi:hypothetical protein